MANIKSAKKRVLVAERNAMRNKSIKSEAHKIDKEIVTFIMAIPILIILIIYILLKPPRKEINYTEYINI